VALFNREEGIYNWKVFEDCIIGDKYKTIYDFFEMSEERGKNFLYQLLDLIRGRKEKINFARYVYILSRLEPEEGKDLKQTKLYQSYKIFSRKMYQWIKDDEECRQLVTAIYLYVYLTREKEGMKNEGE